MSENVSIQESKQSRMFGGVDRIETETADGEGSCFWVPASERERESGFAMKNGDYTPEKYAFSDITVNVFDISTDFDGINWNITIDDFGLPHISIPDRDIDITIDPIDGMPDINIDDQQITLPDIDGLLDFDSDFDISLDGMDLDISGVDLDGLDVVLDIDLDTLEIDKQECPGSIGIVMRPARIVYDEGDRIDITGLEVCAYGKDGLPWPDPESFTIIPNSKITVVDEIAYTHDPETGEEQPIVGLNCLVLAATNKWTSYTFNGFRWSEEEHYEGPEINGYAIGASVPRVHYLTKYKGKIYLAQVGERGPTNGNNFYYPPVINSGTVKNHKSFIGSTYGGGNGYFRREFIPDFWEGLEIPESTVDPSIMDPRRANTEYLQTIRVRWQSPCLEELETSFNVTVFKKSGTHHSGKF